MNLPRNRIRHGGDVTPKHVHHDGNNVPIRPHRGNSRAWTLDRLKRPPRGVAQCRRSQRPVSASQTQSVNKRLDQGSPDHRCCSQSSSPGHLPFHTCRRGSSAWKCAQPSADQPQCGQRSMSQSARWHSPMGAPQSGQGPRLLLMLVVQKRRYAMRFAVR
jgi:hypothetical protein